MHKGEQKDVLDTWIMINLVWDMYLFEKNLWNPLLYPINNLWPDTALCDLVPDSKSLRLVQLHQESGKAGLLERC